MSADSSWKPAHIPGFVHVTLVDDGFGVYSCAMARVAGMELKLLFSPQVPGSVCLLLREQDRICANRFQDGEGSRHPVDCSFAGGVMNPLYEVLLSWAIVLSGYAAPSEAPEVMIVSHEYLEQAACEGRHCKVMGWFPPGQTIYIDDRLDAQDDLYASSIVVHEMVHYLQWRSGKYPSPYSCADAIAMEREAYAIQQAYLIRYGVYRPIGSSMHHVHCALVAQ